MQSNTELDAERARILHHERVASQLESMVKKLQSDCGQLRTTNSQSELKAMEAMFHDILDNTSDVLKARDDMRKFSARYPKVEIQVVGLPSRALAPVCDAVVLPFATRPPIAAAATLVSPSSSTPKTRRGEKRFTGAQAHPGT